MHEVRLYQAVPQEAVIADWPAWRWEGSEDEVGIRRHGREYSEYDVPDYGLRAVSHRVVPSVDEGTVAGLREFSSARVVALTTILIEADSDGLVQATKDLYDPTTLLTVDGRRMVTDAPARSCVVMVGDGVLQSATDIVTPEFLVRLTRKDVEVAYAEATAEELARTSDLNRPVGQVCYAWADMTVWLPAAAKFDRMFRGSVDFVNAQVLAMRVLAEDLHLAHQSALDETWSRAIAEPVSAEARLRRLRATSDSLISTRRTLLRSVELPTRRLVLGIGGGPMTQYFAVHHDNMGIAASLHDSMASLDRAIETVDRLTNLSAAEIEAANAARSIRNSRDLRRASAAAGFIALGVGVGTAGVEAAGVPDLAAVAPYLGLVVVAAAVLGLAGVLMSSVANSAAAQAAAHDDSRPTSLARGVARALTVATVVAMSVSLLVGTPGADLVLLVALPLLYGLALLNARLGRFSTAA